MSSSDHPGPLRNHWRWSTADISRFGAYRQCSCRGRLLLCCLYSFLNCPLVFAINIRGHVVPLIHCSKEETLLITSSLTLGFNKFIIPAARLVLTVPSAAILNQQPRSQRLFMPQSCKIVACPLYASFSLCPVYGGVLLVFVYTVYCPLLSVYPACFCLYPVCFCLYPVCFCSWLLLLVSYLLISCRPFPVLVLTFLAVCPD
jgi:hypothetical protein